MKLALTTAQWVLSIYLVFCVAHAAASMVTYVFTGNAFNPFGMTVDRTMMGFASCLVTGLSLAAVTLSKEGVK